MAHFNADLVRVHVTRHVQRDVPTVDVGGDRLGSSKGPAPDGDLKATTGGQLADDLQKVPDFVKSLTEKVEGRDI